MSFGNGRKYKITIAAALYSAAIIEGFPRETLNLKYILFNKNGAKKYKNADTKNKITTEVRKKLTKHVQFFPVTFSKL
ncbi:MAG: hypothetical protein SOV76_05380 [Treponema succinifaciens]|uniref:hypothetical protein n=1 Tax=Treponema succinifaciens TaxID=167 RepID=UPI002A75C993|nr:hypothetical protein [Treponema succinifaciens]MDY2615976.1 hypothetical protein [Treponema succinifaciens]